MKIGKLCIVGVAGLTAGLLYAHEESVATRLKTSSEVLTEIMSAPDSGIPQELLIEHADRDMAPPRRLKGQWLVYEVVEVNLQQHLGQIPALLEQVSAPDDLPHTAIAHGRQMLADLPGQADEKLQRIDRLPRVFRDELLALGRHPNRTPPEMAHALLHAADGLEHDGP